MLPKWFHEWNRKNPTDIYGPAILVGAVGGAVFLAAMLVSFGQPYRTESMQTGPRGIGMSVPEFNAQITQPDPTIADYVTSEPIVPKPGDPMAVDVFENVPPALEQVTAANYERLLEAMRAWTGIPDLFEDPDHYQSQIGYQMIEMTQGINEDWEDHVNANKQVGVVCYTCHRGEPVPSEIWFKVTPVNVVMAGWSANQNMVTRLSQSTSLPSDALEVYLLDYEVIGVHDLESRVAGSPAGGELPSIQNAERTYSFMNYIDNSLGVNCVFCHNSRAFYDVEQVTPQWATASLGIAMAQEVNNDYLLELEGLYPEDRLGPLHGDVPKAACKTCHKGYQQPMQGLNVIANWPELAGTGEPEYE